jgi:outer membrane receptor protein involved in Fe transport
MIILYWILLILHMDDFENVNLYRKTKLLKMKKHFVLVLLFSCSVLFSYGQSNEIRGRITDTNGLPLPGATVYIPRLERGTSANSNGDYLLQGLKPGAISIIVSFIGYEPRTLILNVTGQQTVYNFSLRPKDIVLEGLVVTAQKREQSIKEIPTAVTSIDAGFLQKSGVTELDVLSEYVPGMQIQLQSPNNPGFVIRGITSDNGASNVEPRVSVFQDGVSISKSRGSVVEVYDMERVEVLKGPQGTLFGRGAQIGAVHFIQNKARNNTSGALTAGYGDYNYTHFEGFFNTPLVKDKLFARVAGIYKKRDGFIKNLSGGDLNGKDTRAFRVSLRYKPEPMTTIDLIYNYQNDTPPGTSFKSGTYAPVGGDTKPWTFADMERGEELGLDRTVWGTTLIARHSFSENFSLTSTTAYREFDSYESFDADGTAAPVLWFAEDAFGKQFSEELRANFKINEKFEGFWGMSYFFEDGFSHVPFETNEESLAVLMSSLMYETVNTSILDPINQALAAYYGVTSEMSMSAQPLLTNGIPNYVTSLAGLISNSQNLDYIASAYPSVYYMLTQNLQKSHSESYTNYGNNSAYEFFVDGTYHLSGKLKLTAGLRLTIEDIESGYKVTTDPDGNDGTLGFARSAGTNDLFMPTEKITAEDTYTSMVGRLAANYSLSAGNELYVNLSRGRRPNVIQFSSVENGDYTSSYEVEKLNDEIVWSYELGTKGLNASQNLYYDLAAFYYDYSDFQTQSIEDLQIVTKDAGDATAWGFEFSARWQANKALNLFGNYAFIDATFDDTDSEGNEQEYAGNTFRLTPKHSFSLGFDLNVPVSNSLVAFLRPSYNYKSKVYFEEDNADEVMQDGYGLFNLRLGVSLPEQHLSLQAFLNNVFDEEYIIDAGNTGRNFGIPTYIAGAPRMFGVELSYSF